MAETEREANKMGARKKDREKKTKAFLVRGLNDEDLAKVKAVAALMGLTMNEFCKAAIVEKMINSPYNKRIGKVEKQLLEQHERLAKLEDDRYEL